MGAITNCAPPTPVLLRVLPVTARTGVGNATQYDCAAAGADQSDAAEAAAETSMATRSPVIFMADPLPPYPHGEHNP
jgi:hypothetical protein